MGGTFFFFCKEKKKRGETKEFSKLCRQISPPLLCTHKFLPGGWWLIEDLALILLATIPDKDLHFAK